MLSFATSAFLSSWVAENMSIIKFIAILIYYLFRLTSPPPKKWNIIDSQVFLTFKKKLLNLPKACHYLLSHEQKMCWVKMNAFKLTHVKILAAFLFINNSLFQQFWIQTLAKVITFDELTEHPPSPISLSCMQISGWSVYLFYGSTLSSWDRRIWQALTKEQVAFLIAVNNHQNEEDTCWS